MNLELIGSASPSRDWTTGYRMQPKDPDRQIWEIVITLGDGLIKFCGDSNWTLDWGKGELDQGKLAFKGGDIPVRAGKYRVAADIQYNTYQFVPLPL